jgi:hypothetical protein
MRVSPIVTAFLRVRRRRSQESRDLQAAVHDFAQAYGVDCSKCHTAVPTLNAYGRYVQRSQYAYLDGPVLKKALPLWVGYQANYDSQANAPDTHKVVWGNVAIHADGLIADNWSYHVQQWLQNDNQGGVGELWWTMPIAKPKH